MRYRRSEHRRVERQLVQDGIQEHGREVDRQSYHRHKYDLFYGELPKKDRPDYNSFNQTMLEIEDEMSNTLPL